MASTAASSANTRSSDREVIARGVICAWVDILGTPRTTGLLTSAPGLKRDRNLSAYGCSNREPAKGLRTGAHEPATAPSPLPVDALLSETEDDHVSHHPRSAGGPRRLHPLAARRPRDARNDAIFPDARDRSLAPDTATHSTR